MRTATRSWPTSSRPWAAEGTILWLTDRKGRQVGVPVAKVAYVELDPPTSDRRVGFGIS